MENRGLLFIPDISGFTRFVRETEIDHSRRIIQELLEVIINANQIGLQVSEIEGDAILFYRFGELPALGDLYKQVEKMFCDFHRHLAAYDIRRFCQCKACVSAADLTLKIITHYGEFTDYHVSNFNKLIGKDVIVAHQLLKNDIEQHEYWLVTKDVSKDSQPDTFAAWMQWNRSTKHTESGDVPFHYTKLSELKQQMPPEPPLGLELAKKAKMLSMSREYDCHIITLFHATGDFSYRSRWQEGVRKVEEVSHYLPRVGLRCRFVLDNGDVTMYASSYSFHPEKIAFSETDERKVQSLHYTLEKIDTWKTRLTVDFYVKKSVARLLLFRMKRKKVEDAMRTSLLRLDSVVKEISVPVEY